MSVTRRTGERATARGTGGWQRDAPGTGERATAWHGRLERATRRARASARPLGSRLAARDAPGTASARPSARRLAARDRPAPAPAPARGLADGLVGDVEGAVDDVEALGDMAPR